MVCRRLGSTSLFLSPLGFGAFKIGRNLGTKYAAPYALPDERAVARLLAALVDAGVRYFDTAPAYGTSETSLGRHLPRRDDLVISTKVGESFADGGSQWDFSAAAVTASLERSLRRLRRDALDLVLVHAPADDAAVVEHSDVVPTLLRARERGLVRSVGLSCKTAAAARHALCWADALMLEHNLTHDARDLIAAAAARGVGVVVKKGLGSGRLPAAQSIRFVLETPGVASLLVGSLDIDHMLQNLATARVVATAERA